MTIQMPSSCRGFQASYSTCTPCACTAPRGWAMGGTGAEPHHGAKPLQGVHETYWEKPRVPTRAVPGYPLFPGQVVGRSPTEGGWGLVDQTRVTQTFVRLACLKRPAPQSLKWRSPSNVWEKIGMSGQITMSCLCLISAHTAIKRHTGRHCWSVSQEKQKHKRKQRKKQDSSFLCLVWDVGLSFAFPLKPPKKGCPERKKERKTAPYGSFLL